MKTEEALRELRRATTIEETLMVAAGALAEASGGSADIEVRVGDRTLQQSVGSTRGTLRLELPFHVDRLQGSVRLGASTDDHSLLLGIIALRIESLLSNGESADAARLRDDLLVIVSHDLRGPLQTFSLGLKMLERSDDPSAAPPVYARLHRSIGSMEGLIQDVIDVARIEDGALKLTLSSVDPAALMRVVSDEHASAAEQARVRLEHDVMVERPITADGPRLQQALGYLIAHAIKRSASGGHVTVRACEQEGAVRFEVTDDGPEIPAELQARWFDRMPRAPSGRALGLGFGLYIARRIVEAHAGTIGVSVKPGAVTFWVLLPRR